MREVEKSRERKSSDVKRILNTHRLYTHTHTHTFSTSTYRSRPHREEAEPKRDERQEDVFVDGVDHQKAQPVIIPSPVYQQKALKEPKLSHNKIRAHHRLHPFITHHPHTHVCLLDHCHVIGAITDRETPHIQLLLDQLNNHLFLNGRGSATDDGFASTS